MIFASVAINSCSLLVHYLVCLLVVNSSHFYSQEVLERLE